MLKEIHQELRVMLNRATPAQAAACELAEAEMSLLRAETGVEYASALVTYNKQRVKRLKAHLTTAAEEKAA